MQKRKSKIVDLRKREERKGSNIKSDDITSGTFSEPKINKEQNKTSKLSKRLDSLFTLFKKRTFKYSLGIISILLISGIIFINFKKPDFFKKDQEISQFLTLQNRLGNTVNVNNKASLNLPFIKNQGQIGNEEVKYAAPIFSGKLFVTNEFLKYLIESEVENSDEQKGKSRIAFSETFLSPEGEKVNISPEGQNKSQTTTSYFQGDNSENWRTNVETSDSIHLGEIYNRIDI